MNRKMRLTLWGVMVVALGIFSIMGTDLISFARSVPSAPVPSLLQEGPPPRANGHAGEDEGVLHLTAEQIRVAGIEVIAPGARSMSTSLSYPGEVRFDEDRTSHIVPPIPGIVEQVDVELGQRVRKDQVLAIIASQEISQQRAELDAALKRLELARITLEREQALWDERISPEQDYLQARQAHEQARIEVANARHKVSALVGRNGTQAGNRYELRAPLDSVIVEKHLSVGERVDSGTQAFTLSDLSQVWVTFSVPPSDLAKVRVGREVMVSSPDLGAQVPGKIDYVGNLLGEQSRSAQVRVTLANPEGTWRPGLFVNLRVFAPSSRAAVAIPETALQGIEDRPTVFVRTAEGFQQRAITVGQREGGYVEVLAGLEPGESLAATGSFILKSELGKASAESAH